MINQKTATKTETKTEMPATEYSKEAKEATLSDSTIYNFNIIATHYSDLLCQIENKVNKLNYNPEVESASGVEKNTITKSLDFFEQMNQIHGQLKGYNSRLETLLNKLNYIV